MRRRQHAHGCDDRFLESLRNLEQVNGSRMSMYQGACNLNILLDLASLFSYSILFSRTLDVALGCPPGTQAVFFAISYLPS